MWRCDTARAAHSHLSAGLAEGPPPRIALLRRRDILVHMFLQWTAARLASSQRRNNVSSGATFTHLSKFVSDVLPCFFAPLFDLPFKLLARVRNDKGVSVGSTPKVTLDTGGLLASKSAQRLKSTGRHTCRSTVGGILRSKLTSISAGMTL